MLTKHISCECKCKFETIKSNSNQKENNDKCRLECKNPEEHNASKKRLYLKSSYMQSRNVEYPAITIYDSVITCIESIAPANSVSKNRPANVICTFLTNAASSKSKSFDDKK